MFHFHFVGMAADLCTKATLPVLEHMQQYQRNRGQGGCLGQGESTQIAVI